MTQNYQHRAEEAARPQPGRELLVFRVPRSGSRVFVGVMLVLSMIGFYRVI